MIIKRVRATVKRGRRPEAIELARQAGAAKIYYAWEGDNDVVIVDLEYEDLAAYAAGSEQAMRPAAQADLAAWFEVTTAVLTEILVVAS